MDDCRNREHLADLREYIYSYGIEDNVRLLGLIDYADVFALMHNSIAVINPSLFEGWSSTVEEAKSMGKGMILSDIAVHREQDPTVSSYFSVNDPVGLAKFLKDYWLNKEGGPDSSLENEAKDALPRRTAGFGQVYQDMIVEMFEA